MKTLSRRDCLRLFGAAPALAQKPGGGRPPNIILILTDDQGWWEVGRHNPQINTPVMDRLAADGVEFTRFYASPVCAPTRTSLMTGRYYPRTGVYNLYEGAAMQTTETTLGQVFRGRGYRTAVYGKWHLGKHAQFNPANRGFDDAVVFYDGATERYFYPDKLRHGVSAVRARGYITDLLTDLSINFVRANRNRPFFLYLPYNAPHSPKLVDNRYVAPYVQKGIPLADAQIYGMVSCVDENIGRLLKTVDEAGLRDDTLVLFLSDNGGLSGHYRAGLKGQKGTVYEGGIRVPFFARWPGHFPAGAKLDSIAAVMDILPTLADATQTPLPPGRTIDGKSLLPLLKKGAGPSPHKQLFHAWDAAHPGAPQRWAAMEQRFKLVGEELYDIEKDPGETTNVAAQHPEQVAILREAFQKWVAAVNEGQKFQPAPIQIGRADENPVELQPGEAAIDGTQVTWYSRPDGSKSEPKPVGKPAPGATINYTQAGFDWDSIDTWRKPGELARWSVDVVAAGEYEVTLSYGCDPEDAGGRFRLSVGGVHLDGEVVATAGRAIFKTFSLGTLRLARGASALEVKLLSAPGRELMALNKIWLNKI
jgi:arylsulfatase A-like enzyme